MNWNELYPADSQPDLPTVANYIANPLWDELCVHLESTYGVLPVVEHSTCSGAPGWNLKYRKSGRALCTLYPAEGFFTCMVSIGSREAMEAELLLTSFPDYLRELYWSTKPYNGGRWLMINITSQEILDGTKRLIALRTKKK